MTVDVRDPTGVKNVPMRNPVTLVWFPDVMVVWSPVVAVVSSVPV
jgi:hypothetical protein